jgi:purine-binding chemotaxis protein CheW
MSDNAQNIELLLFRVGAQEYCIDIQDVREIRGWTQATALPQAPPYVRGIVNLRGAVLPIVDLADRFGFGASETSVRSAIIVVAAHEGLVGMLVDEVLEILTTKPDEVRPTPPVCAKGNTFVKGIVVVEDRLVSWLALGNVLPVELAEAEAA